MSGGLEFLADSINGRQHVAVLRKGLLTDLYIDPLKSQTAWGSLYLGKVVKIDKRLDAAFVDLGGAEMGLLQAKHVHFRGADSSEKRTSIAELLTTGQMIIVQVKSEAKLSSRHEMHKLPRLTMKAYLMGQYLYYSPYSKQVTISRKIKNEKLLEFTTRLVGEGGWILLPNADHANEAAIRYESKKLLEEWHAIHFAYTEENATPRLIKKGPNALERALLDYSLGAVSHVHVGTRELLECASQWGDRHADGFGTSKRLRLFKAESAHERLFDQYDVYSEIESLSESVVALNSGGSIILEPTEALMVIDVNQGRSGGVTETNLEAAHEIARQIRLRNLSGAILIDFINMVQKSERMRLLEEMETLFRDDAAESDVLGYTRLGIIEISRKRRTATLGEKLAQ